MKSSNKFSKKANKKGPKINEDGRNIYITIFLIYK